MNSTIKKNPPSQSNNLQRLIEILASNKELRPKSLISTVLGDLVVPFGGRVWVENLTALFAPLGITDRHVRTSLFRLNEDGWLNGTRSGRKSYYSLTGLGASQTKLAESLIYHRTEGSWDGKWTLVFLLAKAIEKEARDHLEDELAWLGFGKVSSHVWAHPCIGSDTVLDRVRESNLLDKVICMRCENVQNDLNGFKLNDRDLASKCLPLTNVAAAYQNFIQRFEVFTDRLDQLSDSEMLSLRILLIDQYRKIVLIDPSLPAELLPEDWNGGKAFHLTAKIYVQLIDRSDREFVRLASDSSQVLINQFDAAFVGRFACQR